MISSADGDADRHRLAARFVDGPHVSAPDKAEQRLADWLADLAPEQAAAIGDLAGRFPRARTILLGIAEASPYLFDLIRADAARAIRLLDCDPEPHLAQLIETACRDVAAAAERSRRDAIASPHEIRSGTADRAVRHRRRLAGDAGDGGADRSRGRLGAIGAALPAAAGGRARPAVAAGSRIAPRTAAAWSCSRWARWAPAS